MPLYAGTMARAAKGGWVAATAVCALLASSAPALAGGPNQGEAARLAALLREGEAAANARRWEACAAAYGEALKIEDAPRTAGELGLCEEQLQRFADAHRHLDRAMDAAPTDAAAEPWKRYQAAMVRLRTRVAVLFVTVAPPDAAVVLDGRPIGRADGRGIAVEPGPHTIAARLRGYADAVKTITAVAPSSPHIDLVLRRLPPPPAAAPAVPKAPPSAAPSAPVSSGASSVPLPFRWCVPEATPRGVLAPMACVGVLASLAGGVTALVLEAERASLRSRVTIIECRPEDPSPPAVCAPLHERRLQRDIAVDVTLTAGIATAVLAGAAGIAYGFEQRTTRPRVVPTVGLNGGGIVVLGAW